MKLIWQTSFDILSLTCFVGFAWAIRHHFTGCDNDLRGSTGMRAISVLGALSMGLQLLAIATMTSPEIVWATSGTILYVASLAFFWWAISVTRQRRLTVAFSTDSPQLLLSTGPYQVVRHPFYVSYSLFWLAGIIATRQWWLMPTFIVMFTLYFRAAKAEELKFAASPLEAQYSRYRAGTGMFFPRLSLRFPGK